MQQPIREWLSERGMDRYAQAFAEQSVDLSILPTLSDQDLKELGVTLGDRRRILAWAESLRGSEALTERLTGASAAGSSPKEAERRHVTVLFSDLVDSTGLSRQLDPEDMREVIRAYQEKVTKIVKQYDGFVAGFRGDGVLVYFGYPRAHEDDVERAVRAALDLVPAVGAIKADGPLKTRVGIATGLVVVGDLIGSGDTLERNMVGDTPNLAARLLALAEPGSVVLADEARTMLGDFFDFEDLGLRPIKGLEQPVRSWTVMNPRAVESRFDALHGAALTEFSGREDELQLLLKRWQKAKSGEGQVVLISGEPGIGKSRLTAALMEAIADEPHTRLRYFASPQHTDSAFYPVINHMERLAGFAHGDSAEAKLDKLDTMLTGIAATDHDKSLIAALLSLPTDRYPALDYDAAQRRVKTMDALHAQLVAVSKRTPVLQISEDAHWSDPTSLEATGRNVERIKNLPILHVITYRPEFNAPWIGESHVTTINLNRLSNREASQIVSSLAGNKAISAETIADIVDRSDGIPLFLEEMTKAVLEAESDGEARRALKAVPAQKSAVPASLHASLMARLDRLGAAKGIAQVGAAIGRSFSHQLLASVARESEAELAPLIDRLVASGLLFSQGQPPDATYLFKHALIRDAAYSMLLREPRRALHARILEALETKFPDTAANQPETLAHHATEAGAIERAANFWGEAGKRAHHRSANSEAMAHLRRAQDQFASLPRTPETTQSQIELQVQLAQSISQSEGYSAPSTLAAYEKVGTLLDEAETLGFRLENSWPLFLSMWGIWAVYLLIYQQHIERPLVKRLLSLAERSDESYQRVIAHSEMGKSFYFAGDLHEALEHFDEALKHYRPNQHIGTLGHGTQDMGSDTMMYKSWALNGLGYHDQARACADKALRDARAMGHNFSVMYVLHGCMWNKLIWQYELESVEAGIDELESLANVHRAPFMQAIALLQRGNLRSDSGDPDVGRQLIEQGMAAWRGMGSTLGTSHFLSILALAQARLGQFDNAWHSISEAISFLENAGEQYIAGWVFDTAGQIALMQPDSDVAKAANYFGRGLVISREKGHHGSLLRPALHLALLWRDQGKSREAYELLLPVYDWFTEGFDRPDLIQSKTLLDELRADLRLS